MSGEQKGTSLHEMLAVKPTREGEVAKLMASHTSTFKSQHHLFKKVKRVYEKATEQEGEKVEPVIEEETPLVTTVAKEANFVLTKFGEMVDLLYTIDHANTQAKGDIVLSDGTKIASDVPATFLVHLEKRVNEVIDLIQAMATADPVQGFKIDTDAGKNILQARPLRRPRTANVIEYPIVAPATDKHPAQVKEVSRTILTGHTTTYEWSGLPTVAQKSDLMRRATEIKNSVAKARARANETKVEQKRIFDPIQKYILQGLEASE